MQQRLQLRAPFGAEEGVQLVDDDVAKPAEHEPDLGPVHDMQRFQGLRGDQQHAVRMGQDPGLPGTGHVAVPAVHGQVQVLA